MNRVQFYVLMLSLVTVFGFCHEETTTQNTMQKKEDSMVTSVFTPPGAALLQMNAAVVPMNEILSEETQSIIDQMFQAACGERDASGEKRVMVGLAAPQIGICKR